MQPACLSQSGLHALVVEPKDNSVRREIGKKRFVHHRNVSRHPYKHELVCDKKPFVFIFA